MENTKLTIHPVRFSYLNVFEPKAAKNSTEAKYSAQIILPKKDTKNVEAVKKVLGFLKQQAVAANKGKLPSGFKMPLKDGDAVDEEGKKIHEKHLHGCYFFNASSKSKPGVLGKDKLPSSDTDEIYSGMWGAANINFYVFNNVSQGIAVGLNHVMKLRDDERFDGRVSADSAFEDVAPIDVDEDDLLGL